MCPLPIPSRCRCGHRKSAVAPVHGLEAIEARGPSAAVAGLSERSARRRPPQRTAPKRPRRSNPRFLNHGSAREYTL